MRELSIDSNGYQCMVDVARGDTIAMVRTKILEEFDDDMLPGDDFVVLVGKTRLSRKQEARKLAWEMCFASSTGDDDDQQQNVTVRLEAKGKPPPIASANETPQSRKRATASHEISDERPPKRQRSGNDDSISSPATLFPAGSATAALTVNSTSNNEPVAPATPALTVDSTSNNAPVAADTTSLTVNSTSNNAPVDAAATATKKGTIPAAAALRNDPSIAAICEEEEEKKQEDALVVKSPQRDPEKDKGDAMMEEAEGLGDINKADDSREDGSEMAETPSRGSASNATAAEEGIAQVSRVVAVTENPTTKYDAAVSSSRKILQELTEVLSAPNNADFCPTQRRQEWTTEIAQSLQASPPDTIIGVLGNTGVGKSSLLNALLDEASVLPTSGSRGCTAAVVELRFNRALLEPKTPQTTVYKGQVEFISLVDWLAELKLLIDECSTHDTKTIYARPPEEQRQSDAAAAWAKINQVYGQGTMESFQGKPQNQAWTRLSTSARIVNLLTGPNGQSSNTIVVQEGQADATECQLLCSPLSMLRGKLRRTQKKWAGAFRNKINDFVYRKGNGGAPQTWPLIRKVVLHGPWAVLSTGACLVDLPGVRDANAARARVAQTYLQNCNLIAVVAPIQRAVDDGSAKELMGEQFKRRLLMDGQYGNIIFICTQTDSCESTEILRDHADVAQTVPGRYERMIKMQEEIKEMDKQVGELVREEEDLKDDLKDVNDDIKDLKADIKDTKKDMNSKDDLALDEDDDEVRVDDQECLKALEVSLKEKKQKASELLEKLGSDHIKAKKEKTDSVKASLEAKQRVLKAMAAGIRNEYSTSCLQKDFKAGLEELINGNDDGENNAAPLPDNYELQVHCICANDYLKIQGIKSATDGRAGTFARADETNIPRLRASVHEATARFRQSYATTFVESASDMLDRVKLLATQDKEESGSGQLFRKSFELEIKALDGLLEPIVSTFIRKAEGKVNTALQPSLASGANKGSGAAMATVTSWGSSSRRSRQHRSPQANGLHYATYNACVRRVGVFTSGSAGAIDMNQELCDPMEKEFSSDWQRIMDGALGAFLREAEISVTQAFAKIAQDIVNAFAQAGMDRARLQAMANAAYRAGTTAIRVEFQGMRKAATDSQRDLNRSLLPKVTERMTGGYQAAEYALGGSGKFMRMKDAMQKHSQRVVSTMFSEAIQDLLSAISALIKQLAANIMGMSQTISKSMSSVYSVCWDDQRHQAQLTDPLVLERIRACRNRVLPALVDFRKNLDTIMGAVGIEREDVEFDIVGVESWEQKMAKDMKKAETQGNLIELLDSDDDDESDDRKPAAVAAPTFRVKAEPGCAVEVKSGGAASVFNPKPSVFNPFARTDKCKTCGNSGKTLYRCWRCKTTLYCSAECQKADWIKHHNRVCKKVDRRVALI